MRKNLNFNDFPDNSRLDRKLYELTAAFVQAQEGAAGFENRLLGLQIGSLGLIRVLAGVAEALGSIFLLPGSGLSQKEKSIKSVGKAAKEAKKSLAAFDEINRLGPPDTAASGGGGYSAGTEGEGFDLEPYKDVLRQLTVYASGALLALGAILAFSGVNVPLGLSLMAAGAVGLVVMAKENWNCMSSGLRQALTRVTGILGVSALALGAILAFSGVNLPLGLALMGAGALGLATAAALNWDTLPGKLRGVWEKIRSWWGSSVAPCLTLQFWQEKFGNLALGLKTKIKDGVNGAVALLNRFISWVNGCLYLRWGGLSLLGRTIIPAGSFQLLTIPQIPMLAQGAVIPPNAPFLAMLGDQRNGNNIEAPEDLLRQIVRQEAGSDLELMREQNELLRQILAKTGVYLDGREIALSVSRHQWEQARCRGV